MALVTKLMDSAVDVVTRTDAAANDQYGNKTYIETTVSQVPARVWPTGTTEGEDGALIGHTFGCIIAAGAAAPTPHSIIVIDGDRYEVDGDVRLFRNPRTDLDDHYELTVRRAS